MKHIKVKTTLKAGRITANHARHTLRVRTGLKAGQRRHQAFVARLSARVDKLAPWIPL